MFPSSYYFLICFSLQNSFLSGHNSKKHIFFFQKQPLNIFSEAAARLLKNIEMFLKAATQSST